MTQSVAAYWLKGRFFQRLNYYPWKPSYWHQLKTVARQALFALQPLPQPQASITGAVWVAPIVFENQKGDCLIPIWLPATIINNQLTIRNDDALPFMPGVLFDPLGPCPLWTESLSAFDTWLQFEYSQIAPSDWASYAQQCLSVLDTFSETDWRDKVSEKGFQFLDQAFILPEPPVAFEVSLSPLQEAFATFSEEDGMDPLPDNQDDMRQKLAALTAGEWMVLPLTRGEPDTIHTIERLGSLLQSLQRSAIKCHFEPQKGMMLWRLSDDAAPMWQPLRQMEACDILIIEAAERLLPGQLFRFLGFAQSAVFLGDPKAMTLSPLWGGFQESHLLSQHGLADDALEEALHFRGMHVATGSALQVARTHPLFGSDDLPNQHTVPLHFVDLPGQSHQVPAGLANPEQASRLVHWLQVKVLTEDWAQASFILVTLFEAQRDCLQRALMEGGLHFPVYTLTELPAKRFDKVILSTVYTQADPRPFLLDVGEALWHQLQASASEGLWVVGDKRIFDPKCHSPTGLLAKRWLPATSDLLLSLKHI